MSVSDAILAWKWTVLDISLHLNVKIIYIKIYRLPILFAKICWMYTIFMWHVFIILISFSAKHNALYIKHYYALNIFISNALIIKDLCRFIKRLRQVYCLNFMNSFVVTHVWTKVTLTLWLTFKVFYYFLGFIMPKPHCYMCKYDLLHYVIWTTY